MRLTARIENVERRLMPPRWRVPPLIILAGGSVVAPEDRHLVDEIVQARLERAGASGPLHIVVNGEHLTAWKEGRIEDALRPYNRWQASESEEPT